VHVHVLVELPDNILKMRAIGGSIKRAAWNAVSRELPGSIWAQGAAFKPIKSRAHHRAAYSYILFDQGRAAWTWSFQDGTEDGCFERSRIE
jgi:hypothetical protein